MILLLAVRWQLVNALRNPTAWVLLLGLGAAWPVLQTLMALGTTTASRPPESALWQIGWLALLTGSGLSLYQLCKYGWWSERTGEVTKACLQVACPTLLGLAFLMFSTLGAFAMTGTWDPSLWARGALAALQGGLVASLVFELSRGLSPGFRVGLWLALVALIPFLWTGNSFPSRTIRQVFGIARYFEFPQAPKSALTFWWTGAAALIGLLLLRWAVILVRSNESCATPSSGTSTPT